MLLPMAASVCLGGLRQTWLSGVPRKLTVFVLVMDGRRVFVAISGSFQLLVEVNSIELLCLLAGKVGG